MDIYTKPRKRKKYYFLDFVLFISINHLFLDEVSCKYTTQQSQWRDNDTLREEVVLKRFPISLLHCLRFAISSNQFTTVIGNSKKKR